MGEASRRRYLSTARTDAESENLANGVNTISDGFSDAFAGVRNLGVPIVEENDKDDTSILSSEDERTGINSKTLVLALGIFALAALPRLITIFFATAPDNPGVGWYNDAYHHWQIGYLSKEIGFSQGFLRLWDFKGMEYFWGLLHPLLLAGLFTLTGSIDILVPRLLGLVASSASIALLFFLLRRYYSTKVAWGAVLLAAVNPVAIFADTAGLQEPVGIFLLLLGLLLWPRHSILAGLSWGIAGMARAEYWVFGLGMVIAVQLAKEASDRRLGVAIGWAIPTFGYMKYLANYTGNPIYPIYWNFIGDAVGEWIGATGAVSAEEIAAQWIARVVFVLAGLAAFLIIWKRRQSFPFLLLGLGNIMFLGLMYGFTAYIHGIWIKAVYNRFLVVPYMYLGIFLAIAVLFVLPKFIKPRLAEIAGWIVILAVAGLSQLAWGPILGWYSEGSTAWYNEKVEAAEIASHYSGGTILIPEDRQGLTYLLARHHGISGGEMQSQMYDPFFYFEDDDPFTDWATNRDIVADWISRSDIRLMVFSLNNTDYVQMVDREPQWFSFIGIAHGGSTHIYSVDMN
jgi:hypothetical protein